MIYVTHSWLCPSPFLVDTIYIYIYIKFYPLFLGQHQLQHHADNISDATILLHYNMENIEYTQVLMPLVLFLNMSYTVSYFYHIYYILDSNLYFHLHSYISDNIFPPMFWWYTTSIIINVSCSVIYFNIFILKIPSIIHKVNRYLFV